ncbi:MAG: hypothetical protein M1436_02095 [Acidobacteria bacterium]|nr:hypothetical protein [Acidobacteriota bacterium]
MVFNYVLISALVVAAVAAAIVVASVLTSVDAPAPPPSAPPNVTAQDTTEAQILPPGPFGGDPPYMGWETPGAPARSIDVLVLLRGRRHPLL